MTLSNIKTMTHAFIDKQQEWLKILRYYIITLLENAQTEYWDGPKTGDQLIYRTLVCKSGL